MTPVFVGVAMKLAQHLLVLFAKLEEQTARIVV